MKRFAVCLLALVLAFSLVPGVFAQTDVPGVDYDDIDIDDFIYNVAEEEVTIVGYTGDGGSVLLPNQLEGYPVTAIGELAFASCETLTAITIGNNVTTIGTSAFAHCEQLTAVTMGENVTTIGVEAFLSCHSLAYVSIPGSVATIGDGAFADCTGLTDVDVIGTQVQWGGVTIGEYNEPLQNANIHFKHLDGGACGENVTWALDDAGTLTVSGEGAMYDYGYNGNGGLNAPWRQYYESIKSVVIEGQVTYVGSYTFDNAPNLVTVTVGDDVSAIGEAAFAWDANLANVTLPAGLKEIGMQAFNFCPLTEINLPEGLTTIGLRAFYSCSNVTRVTIPASVTEIGYEAFFQCGSLTQINVAAGNENYSSKAGILYNKEQTEIIQIPGGISGHFTFPDGFTKVPDRALRSCKKLTSVTVPSGVATIGEQAFANSNIKVVYLPDSVTTIDYDIFYNCENAIDVYYEGTQEQWNAIATAEDNEELFNATVHYNYAAAGTCNDNLTWTLDNAGTLTISGTGAMDEYSRRSAPWYANMDDIQAVVVTSGVTRVGAYAFCCAENLTSVTLPDSITAIGADAFADCGKLTGVTIGANATEIASSAFARCEKLTGISVNAANTAYASVNGVLFNKAKTTLVTYPGGKSGAYTVPEGVTAIGDGAFQMHPGLTTVTLPDSVRTIGVCAFAQSSVEGVVVGQGLVEIGDAAFSECYDLAEIALPDSTTTIGDEAFYFCALEKVWLGKNIATIGNGAFRGTATNEVYYAGTQGQWNAIEMAADNDALKEANIHYGHGLQHSYSRQVTAPTCTAQGFTTYTCACGDTYKANYVSASAHSYDAGKVTRAATCKAAGVKTYTCSNCSGTKTAAIAKLTTHTYSNSCDTACNVCNAKRTITHSYKTSVTKATLTANGKAVKKCTVCGTVASTTTIPYVWSVKLSATAYTYDGKAKTPTVTVKDSTGKVLTKNVDYTATYASGRKNAGTYKVVITLKGNYAGTKTLSFKINPASASKCSIKLYATSYSYTGKAKSPTVIAKNAAGTTLKKGVDYTVTYASGRTKVGTYGVTIKMKGNYTGTKTLTFNIVKAKISTCTVKLSATSYTYNGKVRTPTVTVKSAAGKALKKGTDYTVTYASGRKAVGTYKVVIKMRGNFTGTKTLTFKIVPKAASINKLTAKSKAIAVKLNRVTTQSTGYQIQYSTSSKFTSAKTVTVTSYKTSSKTISGLKKGKKYYVRVRTYKTVDGKKYYSSWSAYKSVKTK